MASQHYHEFDIDVERLDKWFDPLWSSVNGETLRYLPVLTRPQLEVWKLQGLQAGKVPGHFPPGPDTEPSSAARYGRAGADDDAEPDVWVRQDGHASVSIGPAWTCIWLCVHIPLQLCADHVQSAAWRSLPVGADGVLYARVDVGCEGMVYSTAGQPLHALTPGTGCDQRRLVLLSALPQDIVPGCATLLVQCTANAMFGVSAGTFIGPPDHAAEFHLDLLDVVAVSAAHNELYENMRALQDLVRAFHSQTPPAGVPGSGVRALRGAFGVDTAAAWGTPAALPESMAVAALACARQVMNTVDPRTGAGLEHALEVTRAFFARRQAEPNAHVSCAGHCHIDCAWLWPFSQTRAKVARSWATQLFYHMHYPLIGQHYPFTVSQLVQCAWLAESYPGVFEQLKAAVADGRFELQGGTWVESDANVPCGEALARQAMLGAAALHTLFPGTPAPRVWFLPDTFGYSPQLPQIAMLSGKPFFLSQKMSWNLSTRHATGSLFWVGLDGTPVLAHFPPADTYNGSGSAQDMVLSITRSAQRELHAPSLALWGNGDGGGGPTRAYAERLTRWTRGSASVRCTLATGPAQEFHDAMGLQPPCRGAEDTPAALDGALPYMPRVRAERVHDFFRRVANFASEHAIPHWHGELYLQLHQGTLTSQAAGKTGCRRAEQALRLVEWLGACTVARGTGWPDFPDLVLFDVPGQFVGRAGPPVRFVQAEQCPLRARLEGLWRALALCQFHDVLPGSSIAPVHRDAEGLLAHVLQCCWRLSVALLRHLCLRRLGARSPTPPAAPAPAHILARGSAVVVPIFAASTEVCDALEAAARAGLEEARAAAEAGSLSAASVDPARCAHQFVAPAHLSIQPQLGAHVLGGGQPWLLQPWSRQQVLELLSSAGHTLEPPLPPAPYVQPSRSYGYDLCPDVAAWVPAQDQLGQQWGCHPASKLSMRSWPACSLRQDDTTMYLDNGILHIQVERTSGLVTFCGVGADGVNILSAPAGGAFTLAQDTPFYWDAWDVAPYSHQSATVLNTSLASVAGGAPASVMQRWGEAADPEVQHDVHGRGYASAGLAAAQPSHSAAATCKSKVRVLPGLCSPHRVSLVVVISVLAPRRAVIVQEIALSACSAALLMRHQVVWDAAHTVLRWEWPFASLCAGAEARYSCAWGSVARPTQRNSKADQAAHEVSVHDWATVPAVGGGLIGMINDCKYGMSARPAVGPASPGSGVPTLALTCLRGPRRPDETADRGQHVFCTGIVVASDAAMAKLRACSAPSAGLPALPLVVAHAEQLNAPPIMVTPCEDGDAVHSSAIQLLPPTPTHVRVAWVKPAQSPAHPRAVVLRIVDDACSASGGGRVRMDVAWPGVAAAYPVNILEQRLEEAAAEIGGQHLAPCLSVNDWTCDIQDAGVAIQYTHTPGQVVSVLLSW